MTYIETAYYANIKHIFFNILRNNLKLKRHQNLRDMNFYFCSYISLKNSKAMNQFSIFLSSIIEKPYTFPFVFFSRRGKTPKHLPQQNVYVNSSSSYNNRTRLNMVRKCVKNVFTSTRKHHLTFTSYAI